MSTKYSLTGKHNAVLAQSLLRQCMVFGDFPMHSGGSSDWIFDALKILENRYLLWETIGALNLQEPVAGIEYGGSVFSALALGKNQAVPILVRKEDQESVVYCLLGGRLQATLYPQVTLLDDVVKTGNSMRAAKRALMNRGIEVAREVCILNRSPSYPAECLVTRQEALDYRRENQPRGAGQPLPEGV